MSVLENEQKSDFSVHDIPNVMTHMNIIYTRSRQGTNVYVM